MLRVLLKIIMYALLIFVFTPLAIAAGLGFMGFMGNIGTQDGWISGLIALGTGAVALLVGWLTLRMPRTVEGWITGETPKKRG